MKQQLWPINVILHEVWPQFCNSSACLPSDDGRSRKITSRPCPWNRPLFKYLFRFYYSLFIYYIYIYAFTFNFFNVAWFWWIWWQPHSAYLSRKKRFRQEETHIHALESGFLSLKALVIYWKAGYVCCFQNSIYKPHPPEKTGKMESWSLASIFGVEGIWVGKSPSSWRASFWLANFDPVVRVWG